MKEKKRRPEGREKGNKPRCIPSEVRKMNPNSTCYVQVGDIKFQTFPFVGYAYCVLLHGSSLCLLP